MDCLLDKNWNIHGLSGRLHLKFAWTALQYIVYTWNILARRLILLYTLQRKLTVDPLILYFGEIETEFENILACLSGA